MLREFYEKNLKNNKEFEKFICLFLDELLFFDINKKEYRNSAIDYLFYDDDEFLYKLKYSTFRQVNSIYLEKVFNSFIKTNSKWVEFLWDSCKDKEKTKAILTTLGNKKIEVIKTITMPSFKSLENDVNNSEIITNMLNSIVEHLQKIQKNQNMMIANISHEMRTPLNSVIGYLDVLDSMNSLDIEERKYITFAKNSAKILLTLINDILDTQKLATSELDLVENPFWINKVIKSAVSISSINANQKHIAFIYKDKLTHLNEVIGDKNRFLQILNNIFSNAVKFTPENGKVIVEAESKELNDKIKLLITVKDTGIGIPKDKQKELFKPFSRATNKEKGTGLGLYISKQLAQKMGGDIWFESEENKGTTFYIELVFKKSNKKYKTDVLKNRKIVMLKENMVDDYYLNLKESLEKLGAQVKIFNDINKFMQFLIFNTDINMSVIVYPNKIEKDDIDKAFIKTYKKINENSNLKQYFVAVSENNYYPKNSEEFDNIISAPISEIDIIEIFSSIKLNKEGFKYLIIDDEPMNRMVLSTMIKTFDKEAIIETAVDGIEGLEKLKNNNYDVVFLDKRMPKMGGYEVLEALDKMGLKANIYLLTADGDNETIQKAKEYNVGYISKPVTMNTLKSIISKITGEVRR